MSDPEVSYLLQKLLLSYGTSPCKKRLYLWEQKMDPAFVCNLAAERDLDFNVHIILISVGELRGFIQCGWKGQGLPLPISFLYKGKTLKELWLKGTAAVLIPKGDTF